MVGFLLHLALLPYIPSFFCLLIDNWGTRKGKTFSIDYFLLNWGVKALGTVLIFIRRM